jgi:gas vesicle protein
MHENDTNKKNKEFIENLKEQKTEFVTDVKEALGIAKEKLNETLTDENIEKAKKKASELTFEAKESFEELKGDASQLAGKAAKNLANFAEETKEDLKEVTQKSKTFFQKLFKK